MPDRRKHRSAGPEDRVLFAPERLPDLAEAARHLSWLFSRGYAERSALKLVGDRFELVARQRQALLRCAGADSAVAAAETRRVALAALGGERLAIDGYNVLVTVEVALGGGVVLLARDGCARDVASLHGTWRKVAETRPALERVGEILARTPPARVTWHLESSVSNSGRLSTLVREVAGERGWPWDVAVGSDVDRALATSEAVVASADRWVLARARRWVNLAREVVETSVPEAWVADLR